jgi:hypothetical protein
MCFGPIASFTVSGVLISIGTAILRNIRSRKEIVFALFPLLFALQQIIEGTLWIALREGRPEAPLHALAFAFLFFAYGLWPVLCPVSVYVIEYDPAKRKFLLFLTALGLVTSVYLLSSILRNPADASILNCSIRYETHVSGAYSLKAVYASITLLPYFLSSHRAILIFGVPNLIFFAVSFIFYRLAFISVWCFFAAVLSLYFFLRKLHHQPLVYR